MVRVVTTSVKDDHLRVLWGEIGRFIQTAKHPLEVGQGGLLVINHRDIRKVVVPGQVCPISYLRGMVSEKGEGMAGHHAPATLFIGDEASGIDDMVYTQADTWSRKKLIIGNPNPCENFFKKGVKEGDLAAANNSHLYRKVIRIRGEDSPNVRVGFLQKEQGVEPTNEIVVPGILTYQDYVKRRATWDRVRQCIGIDGEFYEGAETLLYPPEWLNLAERFASTLRGRERFAKVIGVDSAMGGDNTCWVVIDEFGMLEMISMKTPDTSIIPSTTIALIRKYRLDPANVLFDQGGGGQPHVDRLRTQGYNVRAVAFGESVTPALKRGMTFFKERVVHKEERYVYKNRRAQMYGILRLLLEPDENGSGKFGLPFEIMQRSRSDGGPSLRQQLAPIPLWYDAEGRLFLPPKQHRPDVNKAQSTPTMNKLIGCSPDEADALVLAAYGLLHKASKPVAGRVS